MSMRRCLVAAGFGKVGKQMIRLGVDIGGTFTDFALLNTARGTSAVHKRLTTPDDPARAVLEGVSDMMDEQGLRVGQISEVVHGTTLVTNALIERKGARTGMLVTRGFRDTFDIGVEARYDLYDQRLQFAEPLVPRALRAEIPERILHDGSVETLMDEAALRTALRDLVESSGIEALAICFLHSYANSAHEDRARDIALEMFPNLPVSTSAGVFPFARELERWTTTCANAYAQPLVARYLARLEDGLHDMGFTGNLSVIGSSGGLMTPQTARQHPVRLLESGPAAGVLMAARFSRDLEIDNLLSFDLGGTTAKGALVRGGQPFKSYSFEAAHAYKYKAGSGLLLQIPVIDMSEIGAGGGSLATVDALGRLRVGPSSAGAVPGPACYARGGGTATLTDANLALGYLDPDYFLGGAMSIDPALAERALTALAGDLDLGVMRAAWGIHDIANEDIARAFRMHATERGFDYRRSGMAAFGGGGPLHAARIARKLRLPRIVFPAGAGVMSAYGMLVGAVSFEIMRSHAVTLADLDTATFDTVMRGIEREVTAEVTTSGIGRRDIRFDRRVDMRYVGQGYSIEVPLPEGDSETLIARLPALFEEVYRGVFGTVLDQPLEISAWKIDAIGPEPLAPVLSGMGSEQGATRKATRRAWFPAAGGPIDCPVYDRYALAPGAKVEGPCLVEERESTVLLDVGDRAEMDGRGNLLAHIGTDGRA